MKLFLASYRFGAQVDEFVALTAGISSIAVVANATDCWPTAARKAAVTGEISMFRKLGYTAHELDLRDYIGRPEDVATELDSEEAIWIRGGNTFVLRAQMSRSGADLAISSRVRGGSLVFAGYSAGACIAAPSLRGLEVADDPADVDELAAAELLWDGLGLIDVALIPHFGSILDDTDAGAKMTAIYERAGTAFLTLTDDQVVIVDGGRRVRV